MKVRLKEVGFSGVSDTEYTEVKALVGAVISLELLFCNDRKPLAIKSHGIMTVTREQGEFDSLLMCKRTLQENEEFKAELLKIAEQLDKWDSSADPASESLPTAQGIRESIMFIEEK